MKEASVSLTLLAASFVCLSGLPRAIDRIEPVFSQAADKVTSQFVNYTNCRLGYPKIVDSHSHSQRCNGPFLVHSLAQIATCCKRKKVSKTASKCHLHAAAKALGLRRAVAAISSAGSSGAKDAL